MFNTDDGDLDDQTLRDVVKQDPTKPKPPVDAPLPAAAPVGAPEAPADATLGEPEKPNTPDYTKLGAFAGQMGAWSQNDPNNVSEKFGRKWDDRSERYQMLSVLSNFDPRKGVSPEVLDALNAANIHGAKFSGSGDKLNVDNAGGWDRFGSGGTGDIIAGYHTGNGTWGPWSDPNLEPEAAPADTASVASGAGGVTGNQSQVPQSSDFYQKLMQQVQQQIGGKGSMDQAALLKLVGAQ